jgi:hypothetical protein
MKTKTFRKGITLSEMAPITMAIVLIGVLLGIGSYINTTISGAIPGTGWNATLQTFNYSQSTGNGGYVASSIQNSTLALGTMAQWLQIIAVVIAAGIVIGVLVHSFVGRKEGI